MHLALPSSRLFPIGLDAAVHKEGAVNCHSTRTTKADVPWQELESRGLTEGGREVGPAEVNRLAWSILRSTLWMP